MRPHALAAVAFDEEFQQSHPFAPCRIGESHTTVLDPHAADVPQCNPPVSLFAGYAAEVDYISRPEFLAWNHFHLQHSDFVCNILFPGIEELNLITSTDDSVRYLKISDDSTE